MFKPPVKLILLIILLCFNFSLCFADDIYTYNELIDNLTESCEQKDINIQEDLKANCSVGCPMPSSVNINGNNHTIDGNDCGGFILENGKTLNMSAVKAENFHGTQGGVVYNNNGCSVNSLDGEFCHNSSDGDGGVIYNNANIGNINGEFSDNHSVNNGGAVYNNSLSRIENVTGSFKNNSTTDSTGGAICNMGEVGRVNAYFNSNRAVTGNGGAVSNYSKIDYIEADFNSNNAKESGGAVFNSGLIGYLKGNFNGNSSEENNMYMGGGAIMNYGSINKLSGKFENNKTNGYGGAIHNAYGVINLISDEEDIIFNGNTDSTGSNAIYNDSGVVNLNAGGYDIVINDAITGGNTDYSHDSIININNPAVSQSGQGNIAINNTVADNIINMYGGTLKLGLNPNDGTTGEFLKSVDFNFYGGTLDLRDENIHNTNLGNLTLYSDMNLKLDGSFEEPLSDTFTANSFVSNGFNINITDILLMTTTNEKRIEISPIGENIDETVRNLIKEAIIYTGGDVINSPIYKYKSWYDKENGLIIFERLEGTDIYNPSVKAAAVAAQLGGYLFQLNSYQEAFRRMDMYMLMTNRQRLTYKYANKYASIDSANGYYNPYSPYDNKYGWISPYSVFENVPLKRGYKVSNILYGTFAGIESELINLKKDWDLIWSPYIGYNGSHQAYQGIDIYQNGGSFGGVAMAYKGNLFTGLTLNAGVNNCEADNMYGKDNFSMIMGGLASKTGYNFEFNDGRFILQPNYFMSYTFVNTFDYNNAAGIRISSSPLNALQVAPGIRFIGNFENGLQPYSTLYMVWNLIDKSKFKANDVSLPQLSIKPFVFYSVGVRKIFNENFTGYSQVYLVNGGRNGVGLQAGLRFKVGH